MKHHKYVISWLSGDTNLREIFKELNHSASTHFEVMNELIKVFNKEHRAHFIIDIDKWIKKLSKQSSLIADEIDN